jgi:hypothetical protein
MKMKCKNSECGYEWDYKGKAPFWATCPRCLNKVKIESQIISSRAKLKEL